MLVEKNRCFLVVFESLGVTRKGWCGVFIVCRIIYIRVIYIDLIVVISRYFQSRFDAKSGSVRRRPGEGKINLGQKISIHLTKQEIPVRKGGEIHSIEGIT